uniref:Uncharacterized protein n=1 Tax=Proboscia inermis TaxID=420281 RepID=A0A7S0BXP4_9STRA|mmetsp:Transcript_14571/g.14769  ORF Transcript_14571/g.14769 Transcript_14571/m.14769 type:complete len:305 (+) Transcript_14571:260-1174(+)
MEESHEQAQDRKAKRIAFINSINKIDFFDPRKPWIVVPNGSFMGYFNWVPKRLRVGPWSPFPIAVLACVAYFIVINRPPVLLLLSTQNGQLVYHFPEAFSIMWYYNFFGFLWMCYVISCFPTLFVLVSFTMFSWLIMTIRHGISALAPFLEPDIYQSHAAILQLHELLRFWVLVSAIITFTVWNFLLAPLVYFILMNTQTQKKRFLKWAVSFEVFQVQVMVIVFAFLNTITSVEGNLLFTFSDLWFALMMHEIYAVFYVSFLDRFGVHLYPIFSPRTHFAAISYGFVFSMLYTAQKCANNILSM